MTTFEDMKTWNVQAQVKNARGEGWVLAHPYPGQMRWRLADAWEVLQGRAIAVRQATAEDVETIAVEPAERRE
jgi:hypothetical protein